jgi:uncharacterized protein (DUF302 family)
VAQPSPENGIVSVRGNQSVDATIARLRAMLEQKGVMIFATIDHSGEAAKVGLAMPPTKLLVFGSPKAGTPLMLAARSIAIDLPLKILVAEDDSGQVWISYNAPEYLLRRHSLPAELLPNIAVVANLVEQASK